MRRDTLSFGNREPQKLNSLWQPCRPQSKLFSEALNILSITLTHSVILPKSVSLRSSRCAALRYQTPASVYFSGFAPKQYFSGWYVFFYFSSFILFFLTLTCDAGRRIACQWVCGRNGVCEIRHRRRRCRLRINDSWYFAAEEKEASDDGRRLAMRHTLQLETHTFTSAHPFLPSFHPSIPPALTFSFKLFQTYLRPSMCVCVTLTMWKDKTSLLDWQIHYIGPSHIRVGQTV